jgi:lysophospholipase L1-like esterase
MRVRASRLDARFVGGPTLPLLLLLAALRWGDASAQDRSTATGPLVGTWTLVLVDNVRPDGSRVHLYGPSPSGLLMFDAAGHYGLQIVSAGRPPFAANDKSRGSADEYQAAVQGSNSHFGTYAVDRTKRTITFRIEHASFPNWEGTEQTRPFTLLGDHLKYTVPAPTTGGGAVGEVEWRRAAAAGDSALDPKRFEAEIQVFEAADRANPPPPGGVVFIGSSSIRNWTDVAADFPGVPVLNRGFGGSTLADVVYYMDRVLLPYRPRLVVLYEGDNDLAAGRAPGRVAADYRAFVARLRSRLPGTRVVFVSIKPSPSRRSFIARTRETNRRIRAIIARDTLQTYVDVFTPMLDRGGQPRPELFVADSLHMTREGYLLWRARLAPVVR